MVACIQFYPVDNGDMTLVEFESEKQLLIDCNVREAADDPDDETPDVMAMLKDRLKTDDKGRHYVDAFLMSHPDQDHCRGFKKHFYLGPPADYPADSKKILIKELWSSPMVFRRASKEHVLCEDAQAFNKEARRRVARFREAGDKIEDGDRILILGEDQDGKTDDLGDILVRADDEFQKILGATDASWKARLLAPLPLADDEEEGVLAKNGSSTILRFSIKGGGTADAGRFLTGGDADVAIWERLWKRHKNRTDWLRYDILQTPHHCSWRSLSYDSWSDLGDDAEVCNDARSALAQTRTGAVLVASSKAISDDDSDPPCVRAKREYEDIADEADGEFMCVADEANDAPLEFEIGSGGPTRKTKNTRTASVAPSAFVSSSAAQPPQVNKRGGGRYA